MFKTTIALACLAFAGTAAAFAEEAGNSFRGGAYAEAMCQSCHSTKADNSASANPAAPPFMSIQIAKYTGETFAAYLNTRHPVIAAPPLKTEQADDIVSYIAQLQSGKTG